MLWAAFHAFGEPPPLAVLVLGFFVGMLGNLLPLPGGVGGVDGGMIGAFAAFGVDAGLAVVAVLVFRALHVLAPDGARRDRLLPAAQDRRALARERVSHANEWHRSRYTIQTEVWKGSDG